MSQVNLFRTLEGREKDFSSFLDARYKTIASSTVQGFNFRLLYRHPDGCQDVNWGWVFSLFDCAVEKMSVMPKGVLLLRRNVDDSPLYAVSFGGAHFHVDQFADRTFGFDFVCRVAVTQTRLTATVNTNSKRNKTISSFKELDKLEINSGESYTKLKISIDQGTVGDILDERIEVGTSLKMNLKEVSFENFAKLIDYVENVLKRKKQTLIPFYRVVTKADEIEKLDSKLREDFEKEDSTITVSEFDVVGTDEVFNRADSYELLCGNKRDEVSTLDWTALRCFFEKKKIDRAEDKFSSKVRFLINGSSSVTKPIRGLIDYLNEDERALLVAGKWYKFNDDYVECLHRSLSELPVVYDAKYDLTSEQYQTFIDEMYQEHKSEEEYLHLSEFDCKKKLGNKYYKEYAFNLMRKREGFELLDREPVVLKSGEKIEICDLRKDKAIYSVKRGKGSAELSYLVTQSEGVIDLYSSRELPRGSKPQKVVLWMILDRKDRLPITDTVLDWSKLGMLLFKMKVDAWKKKVREVGMIPEVWLNYEVTA